MPRTILQGFEILRSNLEITDLQASTASNRQTAVREAVEARLSVLDSFLTGSYARSTMIAPLTEADVDIFVVLDPKYYQPNGQLAVLDMTRAVLRERYPKTPRISNNGQAVTIQFADFYVDVVPGFRREGGGFLIPDSQRGVWIATDPKRHVVIWSEANKVHDGDLVPTIKMVKAWNKTHSALLRSFHVEVLTLTALRNVTISDFPSGVRYVLDKARAMVRQQNPDPAGYGGDVGAYLNTQQRIDDAATRLESAYSRANEAEALGKAGRVEDAYAKWRLVFGDYFPAYG